MHFINFKTLKFHTQTFKICPYMFRSPLKPSSGGPWQYFARLLNLECWFTFVIKSVCMWLYFSSFHLCVCLCVCVCMCVCVCVCVCVCGYPHTHRQPHTDTLYNKCKSTFQFSNLATYGHGPPEDGFKGDRNM